MLRASIVVSLYIFRRRVQDIVKETLGRAIGAANRKATFLTIAQLQLEVCPITQSTTMVRMY